MPRNRISFIRGHFRLYAEDRQGCKEASLLFLEKSQLATTFFWTLEQVWSSRTGLSDKSKHMGTMSSVSTPLVPHNKHIQQKWPPWPPWPS